MLTLSLLGRAFGYGWPSILAVALTIPAGLWVYRAYARSLRATGNGALSPENEAFAALVAGMAAIGMGPLCIVLVGVFRAVQWRSERTRVSG